MRLDGGQGYRGEWFTAATATAAAGRHRCRRGGSLTNERLGQTSCFPCRFGRTLVIGRSGGGHRGQRHGSFARDIIVVVIIVVVVVVVAITVVVLVVVIVIVVSVGIVTPIVVMVGLIVVVAAPVDHGWSND